MEILGESSMPSTLAFVAPDSLFVGSHVGDAVTLQLLTRPEADGSLVRTIQTHVNLAPILDFEILDLQERGQQKIYAACGAFRHGTLRVVGKGVGARDIVRGQGLVWYL